MRISQLAVLCLVATGGHAFVQQPTSLLQKTTHGAALQPLSMSYAQSYSQPYSQEYPSDYERQSRNIAQFELQIAQLQAERLRNEKEAARLAADAARAEARIVSLEDRLNRLRRPKPRMNTLASGAAVFGAVAASLAVGSYMTEGKTNSPGKAGSAAPVNRQSDSTKNLKAAEKEMASLSSPNSFGTSGKDAVASAKGNPDVAKVAAELKDAKKDAATKVEASKTAAEKLKSTNAAIKEKESMLYLKDSTKEQVKQFQERVFKPLNVRENGYGGVVAGITGATFFGALATTLMKRNNNGYVRQMNYNQTGRTSPGINPNFGSTRRDFAERSLSSSNGIGATTTIGSSSKARSAAYSSSNSRTNQSYGRDGENWKTNVGFNNSRANQRYRGKEGGWKANILGGGGNNRRIGSNISRSNQRYSTGRRDSWSSTMVGGNESTYQSSLSGKNGGSSRADFADRPMVQEGSRSSSSYSTANSNNNPWKTQGSWSSNNYNRNFNDKRYDNERTYNNQRRYDGQRYGVQNGYNNQVGNNNQWGNNQWGNKNEQSTYYNQQGNYNNYVDGQEGQTSASVYTSSLANSNGGSSREGFADNPIVAEGSSRYVEDPPATVYKPTVGDSRMNGNRFDGGSSYNGQSSNYNRVGSSYNGQSSNYNRPGSTYRSDYGGYDRSRSNFNPSASTYGYENRVVPQDANNNAAVYRSSVTQSGGGSARKDFAETTLVNQQYKDDTGIAPTPRSSAFSNFASSLSNSFQGGGNSNTGYSNSQNMY